MSLYDGNGKERQHAATITSVALVATAGVFIVLRFVARRMRGMGFELDDWVEVLALALLLTLLALVLSLIHYGCGLPLSTLSYPDVVHFQKLMVGFEIIYAFTILAIKSSLLLMYNRMFPTRQIRNASIILWSFTAALTITILMITIFQCAPIQKAWYVEMPGKCINQRASLIYTALPNMLTDFAILILPIRLVWNMQIRLNQKYILTLVFTSGIMFIIGSVYRYTVLYGFHLSDFTGTLLLPLIWSVIETSAGIITGCIPTLIPLLEPIAAYFFSHIEPSEVDEMININNPHNKNDLDHDHHHGHAHSHTLSHSASEISINPNHSPSTTKTKTKKLKDFGSNSSSSGGGRRPFKRLGSTVGRDGGSSDRWDSPTPGGGQPFEVRVTTTIEVISTILSNDGKNGTGSGRATLQSMQAIPSGGGGMEMGEQRGGFKHGYGPRSVSSSWL